MHGSLVTIEMASWWSEFQIVVRLHRSIRPLAPWFYRDQPSWIPTVGEQMEKCWSFQSPIIGDTGIQSCREDLYHNIHTLLRFFATGTIPVTTATAERSFSTPRLLNSYLLATMSLERLNELSMLYLYKNKQLDYDAVIDEFVGKVAFRIFLFRLCLLEFKNILFSTHVIFLLPYCKQE